LGEYARAEVTVEAGKPLDLGDLTWRPVRKGTQLWEIGIPNRYATEFFRAEKYNDPRIALDYPTYFPNDVVYTIGQSDFGKDWFFQHVPRNVDPEARPSGFFGTPTVGKATPYTVKFDLESAPQGTATLRLAVTGSAAPYLDVTVNGREAGRIVNRGGDGIIARHGQHGLWHEDELAFSAILLLSGTNTLVITVPEGPVNNGMMYDYIRLELDEKVL
jgi:rhamnogalacturonan endolyase